MRFSFRNSSSFALVLAPVLAAFVVQVSCGSSNAEPPNPTFDSGTFDAKADDSSANDAGTDGSGNDATADTGPQDSGVADAALFAIDGGADCHPTGNQNTLAASVAGLPSQGLKLWLRADHGIYGSTNDAGDLGVCAWLDLSGNMAVFTNAVPPERPTLRSTGLGGQAAVQFSTATQDLVVGGVLGIGPTSPRTFIAVEMLTSANGRFNPIIQGQGGSPGTYISIDANTWMTAGNVEGAYIANNSFDTATATSTTEARVHVFTVTAAMTVGTPIQGTIDYRVNGATQTMNLRFGSGNYEDYSGANFTAVGGFGTPSRGGTTTGGLVAEVLAYDRALTVTERVAVETALKARYAIP
jgi:hypothetical protein